MSWYGANNYGYNFGSNSFINGGGYEATSRYHLSDNNNNIYDPFPPSQREYTWGSTDEIRPEPEPEDSLRTEHTKYTSEYIFSRTTRTIEPQQAINSSQRITESDNNRPAPAAPQRPAVPRRSSTVVLGKRKANAPRDNHAERSNRNNDEALRQKRQRLLEMDDWTGAKTLAAARPLEIQFPQHDQREPVWGWGEARPTYPPSRTPQPSRRSQHRMSQRLLPVSDAYSVKGNSQQNAPVGSYTNNGPSSHSRSGINGYEHTTSSRHSSHPHPAPYIDKGKGRASPVAMRREESFNEPTRSRHSGSANSEHSPYVLAPASSSSFGYEPPSAQGHVPFDYHVLQSHNRSSSSVHRSLPQRSILEETSPYFADVPPSQSNRITTPSFASTGRLSVVSGTLSEAEQQRFEDDGLAILSPAEPKRPSPVQSSPGIAVPSSLARESTPHSLHQSPEIQQTPKSRQPSPVVSEVVVEDESSKEEDIEQEQQSSDREDADQDDIEQDISDPDDVDQNSFVQEDVGQEDVDDEVDQVVEREPTLEDMPIHFDLLPPDADHTVNDPESPHLESTSVNRKKDISPHTDSQLEVRVHEDGLFEANRVNIRAIPDWDGGEDDIEDSDESEREREAAAARKKLKKAARKKYFRGFNKQSRRG